MTDVSQYRMLDELEHILTRAGMYLGSTTNTTKTCFIPDEGKMVEQELTYNPALLKMFDEVISNAVDEHIRSGMVTAIDVDLDPLIGEITIKDNGGIPVVKHPEYDMYVPEMIFGHLRTGSNFSDDSRQGAGMNGLGAKLTSVFSTQFCVDTCDGKKRYIQTFTDNLSVRHTPSVTKGSTAGTAIAFIPDYARLGCSLDNDNIARITKRVYDVAGCNPGIKVSLNGTQIKIDRFDKYVEMFVDSPVSTSDQGWSISVGPSVDDEFRHVSFVNGVDTFNGGTHVDYIANQITAKLREWIKKKHKVDVKPNNIKQQMWLFINASVNGPTFTSQTKEYMSSDVKDYGVSVEITDAFINRLVKSDVVQRVLDWAEAQQRQKELAELRKANKTAQASNALKNIVKFDDATSKERDKCTLYIVEGDSAAKAILSARDPKYHGVYALKGKPLNVRDISPSKLSSNDEFTNLMTILGLKIGQDTVSDNVRFGRIALACDADPDGQHIIGLTLNMINQFWPSLLTENVLIHKLRTPQIVVMPKSKKAKTVEMFDRQQYDSWVEKHPDAQHSMKYYKGLSGWSAADFRRFINSDDYHELLTVDDIADLEYIDLVFDKKRSDDRKTWLAEN